MNPRFLAFLEANVDTEWKSTASRNAAYMAFISDMACAFTGTSNALGPKARIQDHDAFTLFIQQQVAAEI